MGRAVWPTKLAIEFANESFAGGRLKGRGVLHLKASKYISLIMMETVLVIYEKEERNKGERGKWGTSTCEMTLRLLVQYTPLPHLLSM